MADTLRLERIDFGDERFRISYFSSLERLKSSIGEVGLQNPLRVVSRDSRFVLVSGWKRALACLEMAIEEVPVFRSEEKNDLRAFLSAFYENYGCRSFSLLEKAMAARRLAELGEGEEAILHRYLPLLEVPRTAESLAALRALAGLPADARRLVREADLSLAAARGLAEVPEAERPLILALFAPLSQNKQREMIEDLLDLAHREGTTPAGVLDADRVRAVLLVPELSALEKAEGIRWILRSRKNPRLAARLAAWKTALGRVPLPPGAALRHSPDFEERGGELILRFKDAEDFRSQLAALGAAGETEAFKTLLAVPDPPED